MRSLLLLSCLCAVLLGACATSKPTVSPRKPTLTHRKPEPVAPLKSKTRMTVRTTAYTHTEAGGSKNAIGGRLRFGGDVYSAASDWSWLPLGTRFRMVSNGRIYVIEDYGSALVGRKTVDLYKPTRKAVRDWGVRHVEIEILEWGSRAMSLKLLIPRQRNAHVRAMVRALQASR